VADPNEAGTPATTPVVSESAGTTGTVVQDGSESQGTPVDPALLEVWKPKVEGFNAAVRKAEEASQRAAELQARLDALERQTYQTQNPLAGTIQTLAEQAQFGDATAQASLMALQFAAAQQNENNLTKAMVRAGVPQGLWDDVETLVRQSGYRMSVEDAVARARGREVPVLNDQLKAKDERIRQLEAALKGQSPNGTQKVSLSTTPAPVGDVTGGEMTLEEYQSVMRRGGPEADALRNGNVRIKRP